MTWSLGGSIHLSLRHCTNSTDRFLESHRGNFIFPIQYANPQSLASTFFHGQKLTHENRISMTKSMPLLRLHAAQTNTLGLQSFLGSICVFLRPLNMISIKSVAQPFYRISAWAV